MTKDPLAQTLITLTEPLAQSLGLSLWGVELIFSGRSVVRIFVEGPEGVTIDQCAELSRLLSLTLDVEDILPGAYALEVSSPGLERTFFTAEQLAGAVGRTVDITLLQPLADFPGRRRFRGVLVAAPDAGNAAALAANNDAEPDAGNVADPALFSLRAEDVARPDEEMPLVSFAFAELKKAAQVHMPPEKTLPGKGKKGASKKKPPAAHKPDAPLDADAGETPFSPDGTPGARKTDD